MFGVTTATKYNLQLCAPKDCCEDICGVFTAADLDELIYASKKKIQEYGDSKLSGLLYFGEGKIENEEEKFTKLSMYQWALEYHLNQMLAGQEKCLCDEKILAVIEQVKDIVDLYCLNNPREDFVVDTSGLNDWVLAHPNCVAHEKWEKLLVTYCGKLNFDINVVKKLIDYKNEEKITFDIVKATSAIADCCAECNIELKITVNEENCQLQYDLIQQVENCNLTYDQFKELKACGLSYSTIKNTYECGLELTYSKTLGCPVIQTDINQVPICSDSSEQSTTLL